MTEVAEIMEAKTAPIESPAPAATAARRVLPFLLEIGCEEIPARFLREAEKELGERVRAALVEARLLPENPKRARRPVIETYSTPRRLVVHVPALLAQQPDKVEEILGPPVKVSIDAAGDYTRAAQSFVQKNNALLEELSRTTTSKGEYLVLHRTVPGRPARDILAEILPAAILGVAFPKSMYWRAKSDPRFVRPIRWVVALLGQAKHAVIVEFDVLGVPSGDFTFGHRSLGQKALRVSGFNRYVRKLSQTLVELSCNRRYDRIAEQIVAAAPATGGKVVVDDWLVDWIANATEWPTAMPGGFDARFLHLPREILITVMRDHQRYFAVEQPTSGTESAARLAPHFVAVLNMASDEKGLIRQGHERVLTARFRDAEFFWSADQKIPLRDRVALLEKVTYQAKLGSYWDKARRMRGIAEGLCGALGDAPAGLRDQTLRAVELSKCDLTTQMVQEFTELQGVVGGLYAQAQGELAGVAEAIYDHYLPLGAEGASPRSLVGALVSLTDKLDSVVAGFAVGNQPSGSSDPFALRRQANGAIKVIVEFRLPIRLDKQTDNCLDMLAATSREGTAAALVALGERLAAEREAIRVSVLEFFAERLRFYLESVRGFRYDTVRSVLAVGSSDPLDAVIRAEAMQALRGGENFEALAAGAKRIRNILTKSASSADWSAGDVLRETLSEPQEKDLWEAYARVAAEVSSQRAVGEYRAALEQISSLRPAVDLFFDKVLVMAEDRAVRENRLRLLKKLDELFSCVADFAEIERASGA